MESIVSARPAIHMQSNGDQLCTCRQAPASCQTHDFISADRTAQRMTLQAQCRHMHKHIRQGYYSYRLKKQNTHWQNVLSLNIASWIQCAMYFSMWNNYFIIYIIQHVNIVAFLVTLLIIMMQIIINLFLNIFCLHIIPKNRLDELNRTVEKRTADSSVYRMG